MSDAPHNPKKKYLREGASVGFDDGDEPVPVVWPEMMPIAAEYALLEALEDVGATFPDREQAADIIASAFDAQGDTRAHDELVRFFRRLPGGRRGEELRAAFLGAVDNESLEATAARHGVCKVTWWKSVTRLRNRLLGKTANDRPTCRDVIRPVKPKTEKL